MRLAVISDIHGNCLALDAVLADLRQHPPDGFLYGRGARFCAPGRSALTCAITDANPGWMQVLARLHRLPVAALAGVHEPFRPRWTAAMTEAALELVATGQRGRLRTQFAAIVEATHQLQQASQLRWAQRPTRRGRPASNSAAWRHAQEDPMRAASPSSVPALPRRATAHWPGVTVAYSWEPPEVAIGTAQPNQVEVVLSAHPRATFALGRRARQLALAPGTACIVGADPVTWSQLEGWNEALSMYPDLGVLTRLVEPTNVRRVELETLVDRADPVFAAIAQVFKRAVAADQPLDDLHASTLSHLLAKRLLTAYCGVALPDADLRGSTLGDDAIRLVTEWIEARLGATVTLDQLAALVHLSPFHFARCFKATLGLAPYQYLLARRMERAKQLLLATTLPVAEIAWLLSYSNLSHFRRLFAQQHGLTPGAIRQAIGMCADA